MKNHVHELHGRRVLICAADGPLLCKGQDASDLISDARSADASVAVLPMARLDPAFFDLKTGIAGEMVQKFVNYGLKVAILGDTSELTSKSKALHDYIYESNRRGSVWFLTNQQEFEDRLSREALLK
jgi:hypothetical protein